MTKNDILIMAEVTRLAAANPDKRYVRPPSPSAACSNIADAFGEGPGHGCLIGQALAVIGWPYEAIKAVPALRFCGINSFNAAIRPRTLGLSPGAISVLWRIQAAQDQGFTWAEAVFNNTWLREFIPVGTPDNTHPEP